MTVRNLGAVLALLFFAASAQATTLTSFSLVSLSSQSLSTYTVAPDPVTGSGDLTFDAAGNLVSGSLSLGNYTLTLGFITTNDASVAVTGWSQTLTAGAATAGGATATLTSTSGGTQVCSVIVVDLCGNVAPTPASWPDLFIDNSTSATMTVTTFVDQSNFAGIITETTSNPVGGDSVSIYTFSAGSVAPPSVPEPGTILLMGSGLLGLAIVGRRR